MSAWSEFCRKYALENSISYTEASKLAIVKELYNLQKSEAIIASNAIFLEKMDEAIAVFEAETLAVELPEDSIVTVTVADRSLEQPLVEVPTSNLFIVDSRPLSKIFVAKPKKFRSSNKLT